MSEEGKTKKISFYKISEVKWISSNSWHIATFSRQLAFKGTKHSFNTYLTYNPTYFLQHRLALHRFCTEASHSCPSLSLTTTCALGNHSCTIFKRHLAPRGTGSGRRSLRKPPRCESWQPALPPLLVRHRHPQAAPAPPACPSLTPCEGPHGSTQPFPLSYELLPPSAFLSSLFTQGKNPPPAILLFAFEALPEADLHKGPNSNLPPTTMFSHAKNQANQPLTTDSLHKTHSSLSFTSNKVLPVQQQKLDEALVSGRRMGWRGCRCSCLDTHCRHACPANKALASVSEVWSGVKLGFKTKTSNHRNNWHPECQGLILTSPGFKKKRGSCLAQEAMSGCLLRLKSVHWGYPFFFF